MTQVGVRSRGASPLVVAFVVIASALALWAPTVASKLRALVADVSLIADDETALGFIMHGTGHPVPDPTYLQHVQELYLGNFSDYHFVGVETPEEFCPIVCVPGPPDLTFGDSLAVGLDKLHDAVDIPLANQVDVAILGYSQSAVITNLLMHQLIGQNPDGVGDLHVTLLGDPTSAIGGILDRFQFADGIGGEPQHVPFLNIPLDIEPTPTDGIATDVYMGEYDGFANFPLDPSNIFADINALIGIATVHPYYPNPDPDLNIDPYNPIDLGFIDDTHFWAIPAPLPTLAFLYDGGPVGRFFYDAFSPSATLVNNWAYGNPGDPFVGVNDTPAIGPWQVDAFGHLMESGVAGFFPKMDPLQMLAGVEYAGVHSFVDPINELLGLTGQSLPTPFVDSLMSGYDFTNQLDVAMLAELSALAASFPSLAPEVLFDGSPLISAQPLIDLVGYGFDIFNAFGA